MMISMPMGLLWGGNESNQTPTKCSVHVCYLHPPASSLGPSACGRLLLIPSLAGYWPASSQSPTSLCAVLADSSADLSSTWWAWNTLGHKIGQREWGYSQAWGQVSGNALSMRDGPGPSSTLSQTYVIVRRRMKLASIIKLPSPSLCLDIRDGEAQISTYHSDCGYRQRKEEG